MGYRLTHRHLCTAAARYTILYYIVLYYVMWCDGIVLYYIISCDAIFHYALCTIALPIEIQWYIIWYYIILYYSKLHHIQLHCICNIACYTVLYYIVILFNIDQFFQSLNRCSSRQAQGSGIYYISYCIIFTNT